MKFNSIGQLREMLDSREISARELTEHYLDRIENDDPQINACLHVSRSLALAAAQKAQERIDAGESLPLTGIPVGIKDMLNTADMPTTCASRMLDGFVPPFDAAVVSRLHGQDAVLIAKLNMDEFSMGSSTATSYYKKTKNPYDLARVPGGSSGGSAAAVAAGMCAGAIGSDTGGSIRQPAAFCGVTGLRPTYGAVSRFGCVAFASSMDQAGPIARSASDCGLMLDAIAGHDPRDMTSASDEQIIGRAPVNSLSGIKIGIMDELMGDEPDAETRAAVESAAAWYEKKGAVVGRVSLPTIQHGAAAYYVISAAEASANLAKFDGIRYGYRANDCENYNEIFEKSRGGGFGWEVKRRILLGTHALCVGSYELYYEESVRVRNAIKGEYQRAFEQFDALISPVSFSPAYRFDQAPSDPAQAILAETCTVGAGLAGLPSLSTPCGYTADGLPIGLQITGNRFDDKFILSLASLYEMEFERKEPVLHDE